MRSRQSCLLRYSDRPSSHVPSRSTTSAAPSLRVDKLRKTRRMSPSVKFFCALDEACVSSGCVERIWMVLWRDVQLSPPPYFNSKELFADTLRRPSTCLALRTRCTFGAFRGAFCPPQLDAFGMVGVTARRQDL